MSDLNKAIDPSEVIYGLMAETPEQTAQRRKDNEEKREGWQGFSNMMGDAIKDLEKLSIRSTPEGYLTSITIEGYEFDAVIQYKFIPLEHGEKGDYGQLVSPNVPAHIEVEGIKLKEGVFWSDYDLPEQCLADISEEILQEHV